jgi:manganese/zinc/iron transport system permease protein
MDYYDFFIGLFTDYTTQVIGLGTAFLGLMSGVLGVFAVLRKQSLLGDAVAHASLPGIAMAFILSGTKNTLLIFGGAAFAGWLATFWISSIIKNTRIKSDAALAIVLAVFFGFGLVLLTFIQRMENANQAGLETYLFGQAATLLRQDVISMGAIAAFAIIVILLLWKELKLLTFDPQFARSLGFSQRWMDMVVNTLIVLSIVIGLQTVGVILMSALLIAPAAAARQWTNRMSGMIILSGIFGILSGVVGTGISSAGNNLSTGPVIVLVAVFIVVLSFIFAPGRGLLALAWQKNTNRKSLALNTLLQGMYETCRSHQNIKHQHSLAIIKALPGYNRKTLNALRHQGLVSISKENEWCLTDQGISKAGEAIKSGRMI